MPQKPVVRRPAALSDLQAATGWYTREGGRPVASRFIASLRQGLDHLAAHPQAGSPRLGTEVGITELRAWPLNGFPYLLLYLDLPEHIDLVRVLHAQRDVPTLLQSLTGELPDTDSQA